MMMRSHPPQRAQNTQQLKRMTETNVILINSGSFAHMKTYDSDHSHFSGTVIPHSTKCSHGQHTSTPSIPMSFLWPLSIRSCFLALLTTLTMLATPPIHAANILKYAGSNLAGAEFNSARIPGVLYKDYIYPKPSDYTYLAKKGANVVRIPLLWERVQPELNGELDATQLNLILKAVEQAKANKLDVVLDIHNYAKYKNQLIGSDNVPVSAFADLWKRLAQRFANDEAVILGLMNEPNKITSEDWVQAAQAAINAIRSAGANNLVLVEGIAYSGAHSWYSNYYGTPNAVAMLKISDPAQHIAFEVHQYLDKNSSGTTDECVSSTIGSERLSAFTDWLRQYKKIGFLGEFGTANNDTCNQALENMLSYIEQNQDVWLGWTWWASSAWFKHDYPFKLNPDNDGTDKPQMEILEPHMRKITNTYTNAKKTKTHKTTSPTAPPKTLEHKIFPTTQHNSAWLIKSNRMETHTQITLSTSSNLNAAALLNMLKHDCAFTLERLEAPYANASTQQQDSINALKHTVTSPSLLNAHSIDSKLTPSIDFYGRHFL